MRVPVAPARARHATMLFLPTRTGPARVGARGLEQISFKELIELRPLLTPLQRALHRHGKGQRGTLVTAGRGGEKYFSLLSRQYREVGGRKIIGDALGIASAQKSSHAAMCV